MCVSATGDANLARAFRTRSPQDMLRIEWASRPLDDAGRATGTVIPPNALAAY
jgi:hypothetical protein